ncbi:MAG: hypothetical protein STSR0002_13430 [Smithella sp.]
MHKPRKIINLMLCAVVIVILTACSTPSIKPFADQTMAISHLVTSETTELNKAMDRGLKIEQSLPEGSRLLSKDTGLCNKANEIKKTTDGKSITLTPEESGIIARATRLCVKKTDNKETFDPAKEVSLADEYKAAMEITDELFTELTKYSASLVSLAESGQKGEESLKQMESNLNKAAALIGVINPAAGGGIAIVNNTTTFIAKQVTIAQANNGLRESMELVNPTILKISKQFHDIFYPNTILSINAFYTLEDSEIDKNTPLTAVKLKKKEVDFEDDIFGQIYSYLDSGSAVNNEIICSSPKGEKCFSKISYDNYVSFKEFMDKYVTPSAKNIVEQRKTLADWKAERINHIKTIDKLLYAWVAEHQRVIGVLNSCDSGNFKKCIDYKSLNMELLLKNTNMTLEN